MVPVLTSLPPPYIRSPSNSYLWPLYIFLSHDHIPDIIITTTTTTFSHYKSAGKYLPHHSPSLYLCLITLNSNLPRQTFYTRLPSLSFACLDWYVWFPCCYSVTLSICYHFCSWLLDISVMKISSTFVSVPLFMMLATYLSELRLAFALHSSLCTFWFSLQLLWDAKFLNPTLGLARYTNCKYFSLWIAPLSKAIHCMSALLISFSVAEFAIIVVFGTRIPLQSLVFRFVSFLPPRQPISKYYSTFHLQNSELLSYSIYEVLWSFLASFPLIHLLRRSSVNLRLLNPSLSIITPASSWFNFLEYSLPANCK